MQKPDGQPRVFSATLDLIGINPFVFVPARILQQVFASAQKERGPIPVKGFVNGVAYKQTLVRYSGEWRLYINTTMLKNSPGRVGEKIKLSIEFDDEDRSLTPHPDLLSALGKNKKARAVFDQLTPSRQKEIVRYISNLKTDESIARNIRRAVDFLEGKGGFAGMKLLG